LRALTTYHLPWSAQTHAPSVNWCLINHKSILVRYYRRPQATLRQKSSIGFMTAGFRDGWGLAWRTPLDRLPSRYIFPCSALVFFFFFFFFCCFFFGSVRCQFIGYCFFFFFVLCLLVMFLLFFCRVFRRKFLNHLYVLFILIFSHTFSFFFTLFLPSLCHFVKNFFFCAFLFLLLSCLDIFPILLFLFVIFVSFFCRPMCSEPDRISKIRVVLADNSVDIRAGKRHLPTVTTNVVLCRASSGENGFQRMNSRSFPTYFLAIAGSLWLNHAPSVQPSPARSHAASKVASASLAISSFNVQ